MPSPLFRNVKKTCNVVNENSHKNVHQQIFEQKIENVCKDFTLNEMKVNMNSQRK